MSNYHKINQHFVETWSPLCEEIKEKLELGYSEERVNEFINTPEIRAKIIDAVRRT